MGQAPLYREMARGVDRSSGLGETANLGLWYTRFFDGYEASWKLRDGAKLEWISRAVRGAANDGHAEARNAELEDAATRLRSLVLAGRGSLRELETSWRFVTGLGLPHPVENGFAWHPTLGTAYLPGSAVKGLLRAWLWYLVNDEDLGEERRAWAEERDRLWFGAEEVSDADPGQAGSLVFFDALPTAPPELTADVMTPHMGDWYADGHEIQDPDKEPSKVPADWHSPIPVPFLVVEKASFLFGIAPRVGASVPGVDLAAETLAAMTCLEEALATLGAGAKTAVGYGRFRPGGRWLGPLEAAEAQRTKALEEKARRDRERAFWDGFDPPIQELLGAAEDAPTVTNKLIGAMKAGTWTGENRAAVAERLKQWLEDRGLWVSNPERKGGGAKGKKWKERTKAVMEWLPK